MEATSESAHGTEGEAGTAEPTRVLVVEDSPSVVVGVVATLKVQGYQVAGQAAAGDEAIRLAREVAPDVVLMDITLAGEVDGVEAARAIHAESGTPIIFFTSHTDEETLARARTVEPYGYLVKPLEPRMVRPVIEMALHKHAMEMERAELARRLALALEEVEQLRGLLPVCSWCGRVKDDEGYWETLEEYLSKRLSTQYTHGICQECMTKFVAETPGDG